MKMPSKSVRTAQREAPSTLMLRRASETYVSGEYCVIVCSHSGMLEREKKMPERNINGRDARWATGGAVSSLLDAAEVARPIARKMPAPVDPTVSRQSNMAAKAEAKTKTPTE